MNFSYWEQKSWFSNIDVVIIGSGIVGLSCALHVKTKNPKAKILVLENGILPQGASTKNAGFACFGSLSEILDDLNTHTPDEVLQLVKKRWQGLQLLRNTLGDKTIDYKQLGGYEVFNKEECLEEICENITIVNQLLFPVFKQNVFYQVPNTFGFQCNNTLIYNALEGQLDTGKMIQALMYKVQRLGVTILNACTVHALEETTNQVSLQTNLGKILANKVCIATNGFAKKLIDIAVKPARAQVLITKPIPNLTIQGTFHLDKGYYYFRNIDNRILLGGGRNLDFKTEETTTFGQTALIQNKLKQLLKTVILPNTPHEVDYSWSGIMGVGAQKKAIVKPISNRVFCGVRLGGMGVAIGSLIGKELADFLD